MVTVSKWTARDGDTEGRRGGEGQRGERNTLNISLFGREDVLTRFTGRVISSENCIHYGITILKYKMCFC